MRTRKVLGICAIVVGSICVGFCLLILSMIGGSDYRTYPHQKASVWICEDPYFVFSTQEDYFVWEGEKYEVHIMMKASYFSVYRASENFVISDEYLLFHGRWRYKKGNMVVKITEDHIFDGAYEKLIFVPQN